jgi:exodeoxyribonuclease VII large subunit
MERQTLTVTQLNGRIKELFDLDPLLANVAVRGELSNYKIYPSGHHYFTLKDAESSLRCVMFRSSAGKLKFRPESGMGVTAIGRVSVFPRDGAYQLYVTDLLPDGVGDLQLAFEQLKARLAAEGLFDSAHKKPIPHFPERIAVITSGAGAAVRDIIRVLGKRWPMSKVIILPVRVQGAEAPPEIVGALAYANRHHIADLIITGRGGGSMEDLWAFNDERVARAIYASEIPVISAVGHEPDVTIADFVADLRAATPSNGAELAVPDRMEVQELLRSVDIRCSQGIRKKLSELSARLTDLRSRRVLESPTGYIDQRRMELDLQSSRLCSVAQKIVDEKHRAYVGLAAKLDALSPLKVLSRGYSIVSDQAGHVVRTAEQVRPEEEIRVKLSRGALRCQVREIMEENDGTTDI